jgi:hypothetical protein
LDLRLVFSGMMSREEDASAFRATLLDHRPTARSAAFDVVADAIVPARPGLVEGLRGKQWIVRTEVGSVDVSMDASDGSVHPIIENRLLASSRQQGQLLRYYRAFTDEASHNDVTVGVIYLAPSNVGTSGVQAVVRSETFISRESDFACRLSWDDLGEALDRIGTDEEAGWFLRGGLREIRRVIEAGKTAKCPPEGDREAIHAVVTDAFRSLAAALPTLRLTHEAVR